MSRCAACNALFNKHEGCWKEELQQHEELCYVCLGIIATAEHEEALGIYLEEDNISDITTITQLEVDDD